MKKTLNFRYLLRLVLIWAVVLGAIYVVHRWQARRQASAFLTQADAAEQAGDLDKAASYLSRYLSVNRGDTTVRARLGILLDDANPLPNRAKDQAFFILEQVLREDESRDDIRRRNVSVALALRYVREAMGHIDNLLQPTKFPNDGELYDLKGQCLVARDEFVNAVGAFAQATQKSPDRVEAYVSQALLLRGRLNKNDDADKVIEEMLKNNPKSAAAHLAAAGYYRQYGKKKETEPEQREKQFADELREARRCDPNDPEVILVAATSTGAWTGFPYCLPVVAAGELRKGIERHLPAAKATPKPAERAKAQRHSEIVVRMYLALAGLQISSNLLEEAEQTTRDGIKQFRDRVEFRLKLVDVLVLRANQLSAQGKDKEAKELLTAAATEMDQLAKLGVAPGLRNYNQGRLLAAEGEWLKAVRALEQAIQELSPANDLYRSANYLLGECYDRVGMLDKRYEAFRRALPPDPRETQWARVNMRLAAALAEMGRTQDAIRTYETVALRYASAYVPIARLLFAEVLRKKERNWSEITRLLDNAPAYLDRDLLRADVLSAQGKPAEADELLKSAAARYDDAVEPWAMRSFLAYRAQKSEQARSILAEADQKFGDNVVLRLMRARLFDPATDKGIGKELERLGGDTEKFGPAERQRLWRGLAEQALRAGDRSLADRFWDKMATDAPDNLGLQLIRFDSALKDENKERIKEILDKVEEIDGKQGSSFRLAQAIYWIWLAQPQRKDPSHLTEADELLTGLERDRPGLGRIPLAQGLLADLKGDRVGTRRKFRQAFDLGERDPAMLEHLVFLYSEQRDYAAAEAIMKVVPETANVPEDFQQVFAEVSLQSRDYQKALQLAESAVPESTSDYKKLIWKGSMVWRTAHGDEIARSKAEAPLRRAVEVAPTRPEPWIALVQFLVGSERKAEAQKLLEQASVKIAKPDLALALAQCCEVLGDLDKARTYFDEALKENKQDLGLRRVAAVFFLRVGEQDKATELLESVVKAQSVSEEDKKRAIGLLAIVLASNRDYATSRKGLEQLELVDPEAFAAMTGRETIDEVRTRAAALGLQRDLQSKRAAIKLLEGFSGRQPLPSDDQYLLAQLYNAVNEWPKARLQLESLLLRERDNAQYVTFYIMGLLREADLDTAEKRIAELEKKEKPPSLRTIELRARLLAKRGDSRAAAKNLLAAAERKDASRLGIALLLEQLGEGAAAEPLYVQLVAEAKESAAAKLGLATYYARQNRLDEALALCDQAADKVKPEALSAAYVAALYAGRKPRSDQIARVQAWLDANLRKSPASATLHSHQAALNNLQGNWDQMIVNYRQVLERLPGDLEALNNLAYLLAAHRRDFAEALKLIDQAKRKAGFVPTLLDTEALIYLDRSATEQQKGNAEAAKSDAEKALALLNEVLAQDPSRVTYFHLARAKMAVKRDLEARADFQRAVKLGLKESDLHPLEQNALNNMSKDFVGDGKGESK